jgi:hypothetical protein
MCNNHNKINGMASIEAYAEARILGDVCPARYGYLRQQAVSFHTWLEGQEWCSDATAFCNDIVAKVEKALDKDNDVCADYLFERKEATLDEILDESGFDKEMEDIAIRGERKSRSKAEFLKGLEERYENGVLELRLQDQICDFVEALPEYRVEGQYKAVFRRLDALKREGALSFDGWLTFSNLLMRKMGRKEWTPKFNVVNVADKVLKMEKLILKVNNDIREAPEFFSDPHKEADEFIELHAGK